MSELQIGTSGWVYKHWMDIFYPPHLPSDQQLSFYAQDFATVEINFSFYRLPERSVFENWRKQTPPNFVFAVKGSRYLTHMKKLKDPIEPLSRLMERASGLQEKLGPILFQFPHTWHINLERLQPFLELLQTYPKQRFTVEFRHTSWLVPQVYKLLESAGVALCLPVSPTVPLDVCLTTPWTYTALPAAMRYILKSESFDRRGQGEKLYCIIAGSAVSVCTVGNGILATAIKSYLHGPSVSVHFLDRGLTFTCTSITTPMDMLFVMPRNCIFCWDVVEISVVLNLISEAGKKSQTLPLLIVKNLFLYFNQIS